MPCVVLVLLAALLSACGQSGALYLPSEPAPVEEPKKPEEKKDVS